MTKPLAFIYYENLLQGSQLVNRLTDLGYRVSTVSDGQSIVEKIEKELPLVVFMDAAARSIDACETITRLRKQAATAHIPVIAIASGRDKKLQERVRTAGAGLVASDSAFLDHLPQLLDQALTIE